MLSQLGAQAATMFRLPDRLPDMEELKENKALLAAAGVTAAVGGGLLLRRALRWALAAWVPRALLQAVGGPVGAGPRCLD
jgi:hypothetical protein